ncbi:hypothetical protein JCM10003_3424 [Bacteroides pyogenes JCM 10003]|nr:hypothetical protein JCM10003_3424 [Bacteroides pyogenes JCM 10003]
MSDMREAGKKKMETQLPHLWNPHKIKNNHSRRTDGVKRSADLPTAPLLSYTSGGQSPQ